jgi:hypothetical protein
MCRLIALGIIATGVLIVGAIFLVFKFVAPPWCWVLVFGIPLALLLIMWYGMKYAFKAFALGLLSTKSRVLKEASATLISALPTKKPVEKSDADGKSGEAEPGVPGRADDREFYLLEVTITPKAATSAMSHWDTDDLRLVDFAAKTVSISDPQEADHDDEPYSIERIEIRGADGYTEPEGSKLHGAQTLRMLVAMKPGASRRLKFRYYFEDFGDLKIG